MCHFSHFMYCLGNMMSADANMRELDINMTMNEVVSIMGSEYEVVSRTEHTLWERKSIDSKDAP